MIRYALGWVAIGTVVAVALLAALGSGSDGAEEVVAVPPVHQIELSSAARHAGCIFRRAAKGERLDPPVDGSTGPLAAATRRGIVVIYYRDGLASEKVRELQALRRAVPEGTIVRPVTQRAPYEIAVTGYRRLLRCNRFSDDALDATQLFRGRYLGRGPESRA